MADAGAAGLEAGVDGEAEDDDVRAFVVLKFGLGRNADVVVVWLPPELVDSAGDGNGEVPDARRVDVGVCGCAGGTSAAKTSFRSMLARFCDFCNLCRLQNQHCNSK